ncbi:hypothetical protein COK55_22895 [Bacillus cereus]|nr:hypothetical protein COK55_22895 [Bacillus cereus]
MKRNTIIFIVVGFVFLSLALLFDYNFPRSYHHTFTKTTDLSKENVEGMFVNDDFYSEDILQKYGKKTETSRDVIGYDYFELKKGLEVAVNKTGKITRFIVNDSNLETEKGIKIDDQKKDVIRKYGNNYYFRMEQGTDIIGYIDKKRRISIEFWLSEDDKVVFYRFDNKSME